MVKIFLTDGLGGGLIFPTKIVRPRDHLGQNVKLFTRFYTPKAGDIIFDLGSGNGFEIPIWSKMVGKYGHVYAFEPDPNCYRRIVKLIKLNNLSNVTAMQVAIGDRNEFVFLSQTDEFGTANELNHSDGIQVQVRSFKSIIDELKISEIGFLKLNIEGWEFKALSSLFETSASILNICASCHDFLDRPEMRTFGQVWELLDHENYQVSQGKTSIISPWEFYYIYAKKIF